MDLGLVGPGKDCLGVRPAGVSGSCVDVCHSTMQAEVPWLCWCLFECTLMGKEGNFLSPHYCGHEGTSRGRCMRGKAAGPVWCEGCQDRKVFPNSA